MRLAGQIAKAGGEKTLWTVGRSKRLLPTRREETERTAD